MEHSEINLAELDDKYVLHMKGAEVRALINSCVPKIEEQPKNIRKRERIVGIRGLSEFLGRSIGKAQSLKDSGKFPVYWTGKGGCYFYSDEVEEGIKDNR